MFIIFTMYCNKKNYKSPTLLQQIFSGVWVVWVGRRGGSFCRLENLCKKIDIFKEHFIVVTTSQAEFFDFYGSLT